MTSLNRSNSYKSCCHCFSEIPFQARVCKVCNRSQSFFSRGNHSFSELIPTLALIPAFLTVLISYNQLQDARQESNDAKKALDTAKTAMYNVNSVENQVMSLRDLVDDAAELEKVLKASLKELDQKSQESLSSLKVGIAGAFKTQRETISKNILKQESVLRELITIKKSNFTYKKKNKAQSDIFCDIESGIYITKASNIANYDKVVPEILSDLESECHGIRMLYVQLEMISQLVSSLSNDAESRKYQELTDLRRATTRNKRVLDTLTEADKYLDN